MNAWNVKDWEMSRSHIGFTGTRNGMTGPQKVTVRALFLAAGGTAVLHMGCCAGSDAQANAIARGVGMRTEGHPPDNAAYVADCPVDFEHPPRPYLERDQDGPIQERRAA